MIFSNRPKLNPDGSVPADFYDFDYWESGAESGKGSYNTNEHPLESCKVWAQDCYDRWGPFASFMELGCGRGWNIYGLLHLPELKVVKMLGVDISHYAVTTAREEVRPYLMEHDITNLGFAADHSFDLIFSNDVMEHLTLEQAVACLTECRRVAKKRIAHLISIGDNIDLAPGEIPPDQDQSHITMRSARWWSSVIASVFVSPDEGREWQITVRDHGRTVEFDIERYDVWRDREYGDPHTSAIA